MTFPRHVHKCGESKIVRADEWDQALREGWSEHPVCAEPFVTADPTYVYPSGPVYGRPAPLPPPEPMPEPIVRETFNPDPPPSSSRFPDGFPERERFSDDRPPNTNFFVTEDAPAPKKRGRPKRGG